MPRVLFIGDERHPEFRDAIAWLRKHTQLTVAATCRNAREICGDRRDPTDQPPNEPDVILVGQSRPGQFAANDLEQLHRLAPLARLVVLLGSWCEGETRTGHPWPGVVRLYWHQWQPRFARELLRGGAFAVWSLPRTTTDVEQLLHVTPRPFQTNSGLVAIHTYDPLAFDCLADACRLGGFTVARVPPDAKRGVRGAAAAIWESRVGSDVEFESLRQFAESLAPVPVVAILSFPRLDDIVRAHTAGAAAIVAKPFLVEDLLWQIENAMRAAAPGTNAAA